MTKDSITLSKKHGLNPSLGLCFFCGEENGTVVIPGRLKGDRKAPMKAVWDYTPCKACEELMQQGVMLIEVENNVSEDQRDDPHRTGRRIVLKDEAFQRIFNTDPKNSRMCFVEEGVFSKLVETHENSIDESEESKTEPEQDLK